TQSNSVLIPEYGRPLMAFAGMFSPGVSDHRCTQGRTPVFSSAIICSVISRYKSRRIVASSFVIALERRIIVLATDFRPAADPLPRSVRLAAPLHLFSDWDADFGGAPACVATMNRHVASFAKLVAASDSLERGPMHKGTNSQTVFLKSDLAAGPDGHALRAPITSLLRAAAWFARAVSASPARAVRRYRE